MSKKLLTPIEVANTSRNQIEEAQENGVHLTDKDIKEVSGRKRLTLAHKSAVAEAAKPLGYTAVNIPNRQIWSEDPLVPSYSDIKNTIADNETEE